MDKKWKSVIDAKPCIWDLKLREIWDYRDLCWMFIRKNYITKYKQTVFGPLYMLLSPLLTSGVFTVIFGTIANITTGGIPNFLFYMIGNLAWNFFSGCYGENSNTFVGNAYIMGKVYFPRLVVPIANTLTRMINLVVQFLMFILFYFIFKGRGYELHAQAIVILVPFILIELGIMGLGIGLIMSSVTIKYRDLSVLAGFGMSLLMYASPVIYPMSNLSETWQKIALLNPIAPMIELIRYAFFGVGIVRIPYIIWSVVFTFIIAVIGLLLFNYMEKDFIDTI